MPERYPVTIFRARYGGGYEKGEWVAFNLDPENIPAAATGDDISCSTFFEHYEGLYGFGKTPDEALEMLEKIEEPLRMGYNAGWKLTEPEDKW